MSYSFSDIVHIQGVLKIKRWEYWREEVVFTPQWWFMLGVLLFIFIVWIKIVDKSRLQSILLVGFTTLSIAFFLDVFGGEFSLWDYPKMVLPWGARNTCIDLMISILFMLLYQFLTSWKKYFLGAVFTSATFSFVFEPISVWMSIYDPYNWSKIYSFPIYILLMILIKAFVDKVNEIDKNASSRTS